MLTALRTLTEPPLSLGVWGVSPASLQFLFMLFTVIQIGDLTSNGNHIVKMQHKSEVKTVLGTMRQSETYYAAIKAGEVSVTKDQQIELDTNQFTITERPFVAPDSGEEIMLKWLSLKR